MANYLEMSTSIVTVEDADYTDHLEASEMLDSTSQMYPVHDLEAAFMDIYRQDLSDVNEIRQKVDRLQRQVKELRALLREMAKVEVRRLQAAVTIIQAWWRGHLVRRQTAPLLRRARRARLEMEVCRLPDVTGKGQLRRECQAVGLVEKRGWEDVLASMRRSGDRRQTAVVRIQSFVRGWLVRRRFQKYALSLVLRCRAATKIQAVWRGFVVRKGSYAGLSLRAVKTIRRPLLDIIEELRRKVDDAEKRLAAEQAERQRQDEMLVNLTKEFDTFKMQTGASSDAQRYADAEEILPSAFNDTSYSRAAATKAKPSGLLDGPPGQPLDAWAEPVGHHAASQRYQGSPPLAFDVGRFATAEDCDYLKAEVDCIRLNLERLYEALATAGVHPAGGQFTGLVAGRVVTDMGEKDVDVTLLSFSNDVSADGAI